MPNREGRVLVQGEQPAHEPSNAITPLRRGSVNDARRQMTTNSRSAAGPGAASSEESPVEHARRLASIRERIEDGSYDVDAREVARSIIERGPL